MYVYLNDTRISYTLLWFSSIKDNKCKCQILLIYPFTVLHRHYHLINIIYTELAPKLSATASVAPWQSTGLVIKRMRVWFAAGRPWSCTFPNWLCLIIYILTTLEFPTHYFNFHLDNECKCHKIFLLIYSALIIRRAIARYTDL